MAAPELTDDLLERTPVPLIAAGKTAAVDWTMGSSLLRL
jgi:hypothetical protein